MLDASVPVKVGCGPKGIGVAGDLPQTFANAASFQRVAKVLLDEHFDEVTSEWQSARGATDVFSADVRRYAPRVDLAVGPYNTSSGRLLMDLEMFPEAMRHWFDDLRPNGNPRCLLAIEVVNSGSAKHMLGDLLNASALGLYGLVVCNEAVLAKVHRNWEYAQQLANVGKIPALFQNTRVVSFSEFIITMRLSSGVRPLETLLE